MPVELPFGSGAERRRAPRYEASGPVLLRPLVHSSPGAEQVQGELIDQSEFGFRAQHPGGVLSSGTMVEYECAFGRGTARVVWTRIAGERVESGFHILDAPES